MTPSNAKSGTYFYYRCTDSLHCKNSISAPQIEKIVLDVLKHEAPDEDFIQGFQEELEVIKQERATHFKPELDNLEQAIRDAQKEQERIYDLFLKGAVLSSNADFFNSKLTKIQQELVDLKAKKEFYLQTIRNMDNDIPNAMQKILRAYQLIN